MEKKVFDFGKQENIAKKVNGFSIEIKPYLSLDEQVGLINSYLETYFIPEKNSISMDAYNVFDAENSLKLAIIDMCTNITIPDDLESILCDDVLYQEIVSSISNYTSFLTILYGCVNNIKEQKLLRLSVGFVLDKLGKETSALISQLSKTLDSFKPEDLDKLKEVGNSLIEKLNESTLVKKVYEDAERGNK